MLGIIWAAGHEGAHTHWVGFVAVKISDDVSCKILLYVMNSGGNTDQYVESVKNLLSLSSEKIDKILFDAQKNHMQEDIDVLENPLRKNKPTLKDIVDVVVVNWKDYKKLPFEIQEQILRWLEKTLVYATDYEKQELRSRFDALCAKLNFVEPRLRALAR